MISRISAGKSGSGNAGSGSSAPPPVSEAAAPSSAAAPCAVAFVLLLSSARAAAQQRNATACISSGVQQRCESMRTASTGYPDNTGKAPNVRCQGFHKPAASRSVADCHVSLRIGDKLIYSVICRQ